MENVTCCTCSSSGESFPVGYKTKKTQGALNLHSVEILYSALFAPLPPVTWRSRPECKINCLKNRWGKKWEFTGHVANDLLLLLRTGKFCNAWKMRVCKFHQPASQPAQKKTNEKEKCITLSSRKGGSAGARCKRQENVGKRREHDSSSWVVA